MNTRTYVAAFVATACLAQAALAADISLEATCNRRHVYLGESLVLTFKVIGTTDEVSPDLSAIQDCEVRLLDSRPESAVITTILFFSRSVFMPFILSAYKKRCANTLR